MKKLDAGTLYKEDRRHIERETKYLCKAVTRGRTGEDRKLVVACTSADDSMFEKAKQMALDMVERSITHPRREPEPEQLPPLPPPLPVGAFGLGVLSLADNLPPPGSPLAAEQNTQPPPQNTPPLSPPQDDQSWADGTWQDWGSWDQWGNYGGAAWPWEPQQWVAPLTPPGLEPPGLEPCWVPTPVWPPPAGTSWLTVPLASTFADAMATETDKYLRPSWEAWAQDEYIVLEDAPPERNDVSTTLSDWEDRI